MVLVIPMTKSRSYCLFKEHDATKAALMGSSRVQTCQTMGLQYSPAAYDVPASTG